jgi:MFS family permease
MTVMWMGFYSFGIFFKPVLKEFGWTRAVTAGAFSLCSFIQGLLAIAMGALTDRFGPRLVMTLCGLLLGAGYLLMSQLNGLSQLYLFFSIVIGIGMGGSFVPMMTLTARWFVRRRGMMTGIVASGTGLGSVIGPVLAGLLISRYGWRTSFAALGVTIFVVMVLAALPLRRAPGHITGGAAGNGAGEWVPSIQQEGIDFQDAIRSRQFWTVFAMIFCMGFSIFAVMVHAAPHVTDLGFSQATAANVMAVIGIACIAGRILFGKALDRIGSRNGFIFGFAVMAFSLVLVAFCGTLPLLYLFAVLFGFAFGACVTCESPLVADLFGLRCHGLLLGIVSCGFAIGGGIGPLMAGYIFDGLETYQLAFLLCGTLSAIALFLTRTLKHQIIL